MIAVDGTQHNYYRCKNCKKCCEKKAERKGFLEWYIAEQVLALRNMDEHKERLADKVIVLTLNNTLETVPLRKFASLNSFPKKRKNRSRIYRKRFVII